MKDKWVWLLVLVVLVYSVWHSFHIRAEYDQMLERLTAIETAVSWE